MYINDYEYNVITGRNETEATTARIRYASMLLDARVGPRRDTERNNDGYKVNLDNIKTHQIQAVKRWVSWMVAYLFDHGDVAPTSASITLGKFSVSEQGQKTQLLPESMLMADAVLSSSGLIRRAARG